VTAPSGATALSVVVTIVDGGDALRGLLDALEAQHGAPPMEILVAWDDSLNGIPDLARQFPAVRFVAMGRVATRHPTHSAAGRHELFDRRRTAALLEASAGLIAIVEDRAWPRPHWAATMVRLHGELPHGVIGGAIVATANDTLNWAFHAVDYTRYALPLESGPRPWISDVNVCYKRRCLDATRDVWGERYNEAGVHWRLAAQGEVLYLSSEPVVDFRTDYRSLSGLLGERFHWGRLFGSVRARGATADARMRYILLAPLIPFVVMARHTAAHRRLGTVGRFLRASPVVLLLLVAWAAGEAWGAITGSP
jgi:hypothetical protein